jgi:peptidase E
MKTAEQIIAIGGATALADVALFPYVIAQARRSKPRVALLPTASGDSDAFIAKFYEHFGKLPCDPSHLPLFGRVIDVEKYIAQQDVIVVSGGNTKSMLALWREWELDVLLRRAWSAGTVLTGFSAGAICWFAEGLSDSWADRLRPVPGLGLLGGSCSPHYSNEPERRPVYHALVASGSIAPGIAIDDGAAVHFRGSTIAAIVTARAEADAYSVVPADGMAKETSLPGERIRVGA